MVSRERRVSARSPSASKEDIFKEEKGKGEALAWRKTPRRYGDRGWQGLGAIAGYCTRPDIAQSYGDTEGMERMRSLCHSVTFLSC